MTERKKPSNRRKAMPESGLTFRLARNVEEVQAAWELVYQRYQQEGLIDENPHRLHTAAQAVHSNSWVLAGLLDGRVASTLTVMHDSEQGLPLDSVYGEQLDGQR